MNQDITYEPAISHPLVTVVTATYNLLSSGRAENIRQCLESVHSQSYPNIEHLVIDGASTDGTLELLREYEQKGWVRVVSEPDKGVYDAFNKGVQLARGKYCAFLNSDDFWHGSRGVEMSVHFLELGRGDFTYAPATYIRPNGVDSYSCEPDIGAFFCMVPCNHQTMFYRTELLREFGYDAARYRLAADCDLTIRLMLAGRKGLYVPYNFTTFREGGISADAGLHEREFTDMFRRYYAPIIGHEAAAAMYRGEVPVRLLTSLAGLLHPDIVEQMKRTFDMSAGGDAALATVRMKDEVPSQLIYNEDAISRHRHRMESWRAFCALPLLTRRTSRGTSRTRLLGCLPLWKSVARPDGEIRHYLFGCIPLWSYKAARF